MNIGKSLPRVDAFDKVTGRAMFTDDLCPPNALFAKVVRSTIANGLVKSFDLSKAQQLDGVVKILTCFDSPSNEFATACNPWTLDPASREIADRQLLNRRVRVYGDDIAVVVAVDRRVAEEAVDLIHVDYEDYQPLIDVSDALAPGASILHSSYPDNILDSMESVQGHISFEEAADNELLIRLKKTYDTQAMLHCHVEGVISYAYMENDRITVVSSTQQPHVVRHIISEALKISIARVRVIKPYIGGGFGNKTDALYEPLVAWVTTQIGGRCVKIELTREETMTCTRTRHAIRVSLDTAIDHNGRLIARKALAYSNLGGYASHSYGVLGKVAKLFRMLYQAEEAQHFSGYMVYTNITTAGAMRAYGAPQGIFALECHMDDLAMLAEKDPLDLRLINMMPPDFEDEESGLKCHTSGLLECINVGKEYISWEEKRKAYRNQDGDVRRGVGMAIFTYPTAVYPSCLETASARIILNQDGSIQVQMGATEIGQGADTVFAQMAAEILSIPIHKVNMISTQDTDISPFDTGAYASRQTYVSGTAIKQTAEILKEKILTYASRILEIPRTQIDLHESQIIEITTGRTIRSLESVAMEAFYSLSDNQHITAESTYLCEDGSFAFGACFVEVEVDIKLGKVHIIDIINVHDSGTLINPQLAEVQVHGGMSMGLGYALTEQLLFDEKARPLNGNLLDYKWPTTLDTPEMTANFVEIHDPTGPFGNKALGEPPVVPIAPAIRNAILHATGVGIDSLPLDPQKLVAAFTEAGLIKPLGGDPLV